MKIKLQFIAEKEVTEKVNGKEVTKTEKVKDALQLKDLDGKKLALDNWGKQLSNQLISSMTPPVVKDYIEYNRFIERLHDNGGEELEVDEEYIPILRDKVKEVYPFITFCAFNQMLDEAILMAKNDAESKKVEKK